MNLTFCIVLILFGTFRIGTARNDLNEKEELRLEYKFTIIAMVGISDVQFCPVPPKPEDTQIIQNGIFEFSRCLNTTIDAFFNKLDDDIKQKDFRDPSKARKFVPQLCDVIADGIECYRNFDPIIKMCMNEQQKQISKNLLIIVPMLAESACIQQGSQLVELLESRDEMACFHQASNWFGTNNVFELFFTKPHNMETVCVDYKRIQIEFLRRLDECLTASFNLVVPMVGQFCKATKCQNYVTDLNCYQ